MSAELLRRAAAGIRQDATEIPDRTVTEPRVNGVWLNSAYYLTTTPAVALAVADWLDSEAQATEDLHALYEDPASMFARTWDPAPEAIAVARAYFREAADA